MEHIDMLRENVGLEIRVWQEYAGSFSGVLIETPEYENRAEFGIAYETNIPVFQREGGNPFVKEFDDGKDEPAGFALRYQLIRPEHIESLGMRMRNDKKYLLLQTGDPNFWNGGGMLYILDNIEQVRQYLSNNAPKN